MQIAHHASITPENTISTTTKAGGFSQFIAEAELSLPEDPTSVKKIIVLRDTGASQSLLLRNSMDISPSTDTGNVSIIQGVGSKPSLIPLHKFHLNHHLVKGEVILGVIDQIPVPGVHLLLGNDLAGGKVFAQTVADPFLTTSEEDSDLYPACAVTRSQTKPKPEKSALHPPSLHTPSQSTKSAHDSRKEDILPFCLPLDISHEDIVAAQKEDPEIQSLLTKNAELNKTDFVVHNNLVFRQYIPPTANSTETWLTKTQLWVPPPFRKEILRLAHDNPMSAHSGINRTLSRIREHFFWPKQRNDVVQHCRSCKECQLAGKPNQKIPKAPLHPTPAVAEPFERILLDCVGPLPKSRSGNEYLLTIMCSSTRFPEAIPLRNIKAKTLVKALTKFFTTFGLPKVIQTDQGSNFTSHQLKKPCRN